MARSFAHIGTSIWRNPAFRALSRSDQGGYFLVSTQPDISAAGTLPLTLRRWAAMSDGATADDVRAMLGRLERAGLVAIDEDTEELLVRPFIRDDKGYGNPKRRPVIIGAAAEVESETLRRALAEEFAVVGLPTDGLGVEPPPDGPTGGHRQSDRQSDRQSEAHSDGGGTTPEPAEETPTGPDSPDESDIPSVDNEFQQVDSLSDSPSDGASPSERVVGGTGPYVGDVLNPQPSSSSPIPPAPTTAASLIARSTGADDDETREIIEEIRRQHRPRSLTAYVRTMATNGDLATILDEVRERRRRRSEAAERRAALDARFAALDVHDDAEPTATPEEAAAARAQIRALLGGRATRTGDPAPIGALLKAASA